MKIFRRILIILILCGVAAGGWLVVQGQAPGQPSDQQRAGRRSNQDQPVPVLASAATIADVPVYIVGVGTVQALNTVTVNTLVNGTLMKVNFKEGQDVKAGDVLALIDPTAYKATLDQAVAKKAYDEALLANARLDLARYANLVKTNAVTTQQYDTQKALVDQDVAQVALDQGAVDNAKAYVDWCTITAPLAGRLGLRLVDQGNIVNTTSTSGIVVITQLQPISVVFSLPQQNLTRINPAFAKGPLSVDAMDADNQTVLDTGKLEVVNNQVDQTTGTVKLKANFPNPKLLLWPGQFVNVRLLIATLPKVVVVPSVAVQRGPNGPFVYVLQPDDTVTLKDVTITQQDEKQAVIASGVQPPDRVVTSGFVQLADRRKVKVADAQPSPNAAKPTGGDGQGEHRGGRAGRDGQAEPGAGRAAQDGQAEPKTGAGTRDVETRGQRERRAAERSAARPPGATP
jgi:multidrug efflux system membrane fusion protein